MWHNVKTNSKIQNWMTPSNQSDVRISQKALKRRRSAIVKKNYVPVNSSFCGVKWWIVHLSTDVLHIGKTLLRYNNRYCTIKIPSWFKAVSSELRCKFCSSSPANVISTYEWTFLGRDTKHYVINQSAAEIKDIFLSLRKKKIIKMCHKCFP